MNRAFILDRDGTINVEKDHLYKTVDFEFIKGVPSTIKFLNEKGYKVLVITNQSGIARGYYTEQDVLKLHKYIDKELEKYNAHVDEYFFCPHHPTCGIGKYKLKCACRKPGVGMYLDAVKKWDIDCGNSYAVGDKLTDLIPAKLLKMHTILVETGYGSKEKKAHGIYEYRLKSLEEIKLIGGL